MLPYVSVDDVIADISFIHHRYRDLKMLKISCKYLKRGHFFYLSSIPRRVDGCIHRDTRLRGHFFYPSSIPRPRLPVRRLCLSLADISFIHHRYRDSSQFGFCTNGRVADISFIHHRYRDTALPTVGLNLVPADISFIHHRYRDEDMGDVCEECFWADISFIHHRYRDLRKGHPRMPRRWRTFLLSIIDTATLVAVRIERAIKEADISFIHHRYRDLTAQLSYGIPEHADISFIHHRYRDLQLECRLLETLLRTFLLSIIDTATAHVVYGRALRDERTFLLSIIDTATCGRIANRTWCACGHFFYPSSIPRHLSKLGTLYKG